MIKLTMPPRPDVLTDELVARKTAEFIADPNLRVWDIDELKKVLKQSSFCKCAFSEVKLDEEGKYMHVEHFYPKSIYPEKVLEWGNLLPCLNVGNSKKNNTDPAVTPLVNPYVDNPKEYFYLKAGRLYPHDKNDQKAIKTIELYDLNNPVQLRQPRLRIISKIKEELADIRRCFDKWNDPEVGRNRLERLLRDCGRASAYSAARATYILDNEDYRAMRASLLSNPLWAPSFILREQELIFCSLPQKT